MKWLLRPSRPRAPAQGLSGNMWWRLRPNQISPSFMAPSWSGWPAIQAALTAPTEVPISKSGRIPPSVSAWSIPTWTAPRLPPPDRTKTTGPRATTPLRRGQLRLIELDPQAPKHSGSPLGVVILGPLRSEVLEERRGVHPVPQPPVGFGAPDLVEKGFELRVKVGRVRSGLEFHISSPTTRTRTRPFLNYHHWTDLPFHL